MLSYEQKCPESLLKVHCVTPVLFITDKMPKKINLAFSLLRQLPLDLTLLNVRSSHARLHGDVD